MLYLPIKVEIIYSAELRDRIFVKDDGFLPFTKNMWINIGKNLSGKHSLIRLDHAK